MADCTQTFKTEQELSECIEGLEAENKRLREVLENIREDCGLALAGYDLHKADTK